MGIKHIVISGNIGVGKTTLSEKLSKKFNWDLQLEEVDDLNKTIRGTGGFGSTGTK